MPDDPDPVLHRRAQEKVATCEKKMGVLQMKIARLSDPLRELIVQEFEENDAFFMCEHLRQLEELMCTVQFKNDMDV